MPSITITDTPSPVVIKARRQWLRLANTSANTIYLLVGDNKVTAEDGPHSGLPLAPGETAYFSGTVLNSVKQPFALFAVTQAGVTAILRYQDYQSAPEPLPAGSLTFNGFAISLNGESLTF